MAYEVRVTDNARDDLSDLEHDERFLKRIAESRRQAQSGAFVRLEDLPSE